MLEYLDYGSIRLQDSTASIVRSLTRVDGLTGIAGVRGEHYDRPEGDGEVEAPVQYETARIISLDGETWAATVASAWTDWRALLTVLRASMNTDTLIKWREVGGAVDLQCTVRLAGGVLPPLEDGVGRLAYLIQARAADPLNYSQTLSSTTATAPTSTGGIDTPVRTPIRVGAVSGGTCVVANAGNAPTWPKFTITGPIVQPVVLDVTTNLAIYCDGISLSAGDVLVIDTNPANRIVTANGANAMGGVRFADSTFFSIAGGASDTIQFYGLGGGYTVATGLTVEWRNAYSG